MDAISAFWSNAVGINIQSFLKILSISSFSKSVKLNNSFSLNLFEGASYILFHIFSSSTLYWFQADSIEALINNNSSVNMYIPYESSSNGSGSAVLNINYADSIICKFTKTSGAVSNNGNFELTGCVIYLSVL